MKWLIENGALLLLTAEADDCSEYIAWVKNTHTHTHTWKRD